MSHMVIHRSPDGQAVYHETDSLEDAARHLEQLRNSGQGTDARIFRMHEIPVEVKTYYKVEVPVEGKPEAAAAAAPAPAAAPAAEAATPAEAPAAAPAEAPPAAQTPPQPAAHGSKAEPVAAGANGGRFGLFGKG